MEHSFLVKTKGWLVNPVSLGEVMANCHFHTWTANHRFAWVEYNKTELTGLAVEKEVAIPQGWSIQETQSPDGYCAGIFDPGGAPETGMMQYIEIHDVWCTQEMTDEMLGTFVGQNTNALVAPSFLPYNYTSGTYPSTPQEPPYLDWEQVVAARSRMWTPYASQAGAKNMLVPVNATVRREFLSKLHDNQWGSGDAIASLDLHHYRIMIINIDQTTPGEIVPDSGWYANIPPSNQPMMASVVKPDFLTRMTMERRSKGV